MFLSLLTGNGMHLFSVHFVSAYNVEANVAALFFVTLIKSCVVFGARLLLTFHFSVDCQLPATGSC